MEWNGLQWASHGISVELEGGPRLKVATRLGSMRAFQGRMGQRPEGSGVLVITVRHLDFRRLEYGVTRRPMRRSHQPGIRSALTEDMAVKLARKTNPPFFAEADGDVADRAVARR
jgi:hypothetical protein